MAALLWTVQLAAAQQNTCSSFCSSLGMMQSNPGKSCDDIYKINKQSRGASGDYWINTTTGVHQVYCDMELECGGHKGGWMRIADLDTSRGDDCPTGWTKITTPNDPVQPVTDVCRSPNDNAGCHPTTFSVSGASYHKICGRVRGYQGSSTDGFGGPRGGKGINNAYVDGVSVTLGSPRKHVWTYVSGFSDGGTQGSNNCPCDDAQGGLPFPFIGTHYYCESGRDDTSLTSSLFTSDPLWDGSGCIGAQNNCCAKVGMPWFLRQFPTAQEDDIEVRICTDQALSDEAVTVDQIQLFVQ